MKNYIIHLARAKEREARVQYLTDILPGDVEILEAVDGQLLGADCLAAYSRHIHHPRYPFELRYSEIACFHSHRKSWQKIANGSDDFALICEDDILLDETIFPIALALATEQISPDSFIRFPVSVRETFVKEIATDNGISLFKPKYIGLGMHLQLVGRDYARKLLDFTQTFDRPVDTLLQMHWVSQLIPYSIQPSGVSEMDKDIGGSSIGQKMSVSQKMWRELKRPIYRNSLKKHPIA